MPRVLKRIIAVVFSLGLVVAAIWGGLILYRDSQRKPVNVYQVENFAMTNYWGDTSTTYGFVRLEGLQRVDVSDTATITEVFVTEGQEVRKGDPLASYDTTLTALDLEKAQIDVSRQKLNLDKMEKELEAIKVMRPSSGKPTVIQPEYDYVTTLPEVLTEKTPDSGFYENPIVLLWDMNRPVRLQDLIKTLEAEGLLREPRENVPDPTETPEPAETVEPTETPDADTTPAADPTETAEASPEPSVTPAETTDADTTPAGADPTVTPEPTQSPEPDQDGDSQGDGDPGYSDAEGELCVIVLIRAGSAGNARNGSTMAQYGFTLTLDGEGGVSDLSLSMQLPLPEGVPEEAQPTIIPDRGSGYTKAEIAKMRNDQEVAIRDAKLALEIAELDLKRKEAEVGDGMIRAELDGVVKTLNDPQAAFMENLPLMLISAGGGYYIEGTLSELELDTIKPGMTVTVNSWRSGTMTQGTVTEISDIPVQDEMRGYDGTNASYYPFEVFVDDSVDLMESEYVEMSYQGVTDAANYFYLEKMFIRTENGKAYCMVKNENGLLERRWISPGVDLWGSYTQIRGGLSLEDRVAFPYGKDVVEGAQTVDAEPDAFYSMN